MSPPVFEDNESIANEETLYRRISVHYLVPDEDTGFARVSSGAFKHRELSVNLHSVLEQNGYSPDACLSAYPLERLVSLRAEAARSCNQALCRDPLPDDLSHGLVYGNKNGKTPEKLTAASNWVIPAGPPPYTQVEAEKKAAGLL
jgi:hypothetical protein